MAQRYLFFDGMKAVNINNLPPEAWTVLGQQSGGDMAKYYAAVPWLWRGTDLRAQAVSTLPFGIVKLGSKENADSKDAAPSQQRKDTKKQKSKDFDNSEDYQNAVGFLPDPATLLYLVESSLTLQGRAYLFREHNRVKTLGLRYILASSIKPLIDKDKGLIGFERQLGNERREFDIQDIVYFWLRDPFTEIGPPTDGKCPGQAALQAAGVLYHLDEFASAFFERGAIKATILKVGGTLPPEAERRRIKAWWKRIFSGIGNAFATEIVSSDTEVETIGEGIGELADTELTKTMREDISTALGIPQSILFSNAANFAVAQQDDIHFYSKTIVPEALFIQSVLNEQLFKPAGLQFEFRPETLDVFQEDEAKRSEALVHLTGAGLRPSVAMQILGYELPPGVTFEMIDQMREEDRERRAEQFAASPFGQNPQQNPQQQAQQKAMMADLRAWRTKARKAGGPVPFESDHIPAAIMETIRATIELYDVETAFEFLKKNH